MGQFQKREKNNGVQTNHPLFSAGIGNGAVFGGCASRIFADGKGETPVPGDKIEEITVTARKTRENLQDTPISITAVSAAQLEQRGISEISKIQEFTPNLTFKNVPSNSGVASNAAIYIRGIGQNEFAPSVDPGVGIYVDGVYMGRSVGGVFDAIDLASVEVLRGPQGTLFGRNTIGGAVNITSAQPTDYWTGRADMKFGTGGRANIRGVVSGPITDTLSFKLAGGIFSQDGYVDAPNQGHKLGNQDTQSVKGALLWKPSSRLDITLAGDFLRDNSYGPPVVVTGINQSAYASGSSLVFLNNLLAGGMNPGTCLSAASSADTSCFNSRVFSKTTNYGTDPDYSHISTGGVSLTATYRFSEAAVLKSVSSWRMIDGNFAQDRDGSNLGINYVHNLYKQQQFTQELQLSGKLGSNLKYAAGLYFFSEWGHDLNPVQFLVLSENSGGSFNYKSWAAYGQATWTIVPGLDLTGGVRYTRDYKDFTTAQLVTRVLMAPSGRAAHWSMCRARTVLARMSCRAEPIATIRAGRRRWPIWPIMSPARSWAISPIRKGSRAAGSPSVWPLSLPRCPPSSPKRSIPMNWASNIRCRATGCA
jgi:iron complex outermembrane receptor protein